MKLRHRVTALLAGFTAVAAGFVSAGAGGAAAAAPDQAQRQVTVMTQNLYLGANLTPLFTPGVDFSAAAVGILQHVAQVDFPARAAKIAEEIDAQDPDLVGLQEVARWQLGPDCTHLGDYVDYLTELLAALEARGLHYAAVSADSNFHAVVPLAISQTIGCAAFTDRDVILARTDLRVSRMQLSNPQSGEFGDYSPLVAGVPNEMPVTITIPGLGSQTVSVTRGWTSIDVMVRGKIFRFVDTHLEAYGPPSAPALFRNIQAHLLATNVIATSPYPVVAVGDYNSHAAPDVDSTGAYGILTTGAGMTDAWLGAGREGDAGYTSGQTDDLNVVPSRIDHRIDLVLLRGAVRAVPDSGVVVGDAPGATGVAAHAAMAWSATTGQWLWPSDHAGVVVTVDVAKP